MLQDRTPSHGHHGCCCCSLCISHFTLLEQHCTCFLLFACLFDFVLFLPECVVRRASVRGSQSHPSHPSHQAPLCLIMGRFRFLGRHYTDEDEDDDDNNNHNHIWDKVRGGTGGHHIDDRHYHTSSCDRNDNVKEEKEDAAAAAAVATPMDWEFVPSNSHEATALALFRNDLDDNDEVDVYDHPTYRNSADPSSSRSNMSTASTYEQGVGGGRGRNHMAWPPHQEPQQAPFIVLVPSDSSLASSFLGVVPPDGKRKRSRNSSVACCSNVVWYGTCLLVMAIAIWLPHHGPPGPPKALGGTAPTTAASTAPTTPSATASSTWGNYLGHHTQQLKDSVTALAIHTPLHLLYWWIEFVRVEIVNSPVWQKWVSPRGRHRRTCSRRVPTNLHDLLRVGSPPNTLPLVGQPWAVQAVSEAAHAWHHHNHGGGGGPLVLFFTGYPSSGKRTLARSLVHALSNCTSTADGGGAVAAPPMTVLPADRYQSRSRGVPHHHWYNDDDDSRDDSRELTHLKLQLEHDVLRHTTWYHPDQPPSSNGSTDQDEPTVSFVLLDHVEDMAPGLLKWFVSELSSEKSPTPIIDEPTLELDPTLVSFRQRCRRTVFFLTSSSVGTKSIATWIRQYQPLAQMMMPSPLDARDYYSRAVSVPRMPPSISLDLADEINAAFGKSVSNHLSFGAIPFVPLTPESLVQLFLIRLHEYATQHSTWWKDVVLPESDVSRLLQRRVELVSWRHRQPPSSSSSSSSSSMGEDAKEIDETAAEASDEHGEAPEPPPPPSVLLTFATAGAAAVTPVLHELVAHLGRCAMEAGAADGEANGRSHVRRAGKTAFVELVPDDTDNGDNVWTGRVVWCGEYALPATCEGECTFSWA